MTRPAPSHRRSDLLEAVRKLRRAIDAAVRPLLLAAISLSGLLVETALGGMPETVYWANRDLAVPYQWSGAPNAAGASRVVLYYSTDRGRTWRTAAEAQPHVRSFRFRAPSDGEHWFAVRTFDAFGQATPPTPLGAEMRVLVDTTRPTISSESIDWRDGLLSLRLSVDDPGGVAAERVHAYAQTDGRNGWSSITLGADPLVAGPGGATLQGQWRPPADATRVEVRVTAEDRAGNRTERTLTAMRDRDPSAYAPLTATPPATRPTTSRDPFAEIERRSPNAARGPSAFGFAAQPDRRAPTTQRSQIARQEPRAAASMPWPAEPQRHTPIAASRDARWPDPASSPPARPGPFSNASFDPHGSLDAANERLGAPAPSRLVNSTEFEFDYELDSTGRWGVSKVELWGTPDDGRSWQRFAVDSDRQSPIHVSAPGEGTFGFRLIVESVGGLDAETPRPGDAPEAVVRVDLTRPRVVLRSARQGDGYFADQLIVEWDAADQNAAAKPIDLYYSNRPTGPWAPIAAGLADTGRHAWRLQRHLPRRVFVKVEARDRAGNVGSATTAEPVLLDVPTAGGSLRGVRPAG